MKIKKTEQQHIRN